MQKTNITRLIAAFALLLITSGAWSQTYAPKSYYTFESATTPMKDSMGYFNLDPAYYTAGYTISPAVAGSGVGKYMTLDSTGNMIRGGILAADSGVTFEFIFKPGYYFSSTVFLRRLDGAIEVRMAYPQIQFQTNVKANAGGYVYDDFIIDLNGTGRKSWGHYIDGNWHHMVFKYNARTGAKQVWIDGQLPAGFSKTLAPGYFEQTGNREYHFDSGTSYYKYHGGIDEIAVYYYALPDNMIYKHYQEVTAHNHYSFGYTSTAPPAPAPVTAGITINEYAPGHPNPSLTPIDQLKNFPTPRYKPGHTLFPINPFVGYPYLSGYQTYASSYAAAVANSKVLQTDFASNFNYLFLATENTGEYSEFGDTTRFSGAWIKLANQNPSWKTSALTYWPQLHPADAGFVSNPPYVTCGCLPNNTYLRNSSGQYLNPSGGTGSQKWISPAGPKDSLAKDGLTQKLYLQTLLNKMTRPLDYVFENGEVIPFLFYSNVMTQDPAVVSDKNSTGLDWLTYEGKRASEKIKTYRDQFMGSLSGLSNTKFAYYQLDGQPQWNWKWSEVRGINTSMNNSNYATGDIYVRWPNNWRNWTSAWHGWQWVVESRHEQLASGDKYFSPAVSPGWDNDEEQNVRPAQWLGFLKAVSMLGAEFYTTGYFVTSTPYQNPKNYVWQLVIPPYAQAITSRYEDLFRNGSIMPGNVPNSTTNPQWMAYNFYTGDPRKLVVIRKSNTINKYAITGTIQPSSNMDGSTELESTAQITLDGQVLKLKVRRQGSTYIYDNSNTANPVFYHLDGWHETTHPYYWSKDFNIEGENFDNTNASVSIKTRRPSGTLAGDFTNFTSSVVFNAATDVVYNFQPRSLSNSNFYFWVRARSTNGTSTGMSITLDGGNTKTIGCITDTNWVWYKYNVSDGLVISYNSVSSGANHALRITSNNANLEIDRIVLSTSNASLYTSAPPCGSVAVPVITAGGATTFCTGGSVTLTSSAGNSYLWSTGATTQAITVTTAGSYIVTVTTASGTASSAPVTITVNALPTATITASGSTMLCPGGSVTLTASSGSSYLWSPGNQTSQAITLNTAGSYTVRVTNSNGCSKVSSATTITMGTNPTATISAGSATTFCTGGSVTLTSTSGSSYLWTPGNQTTQSISATATGSYTVRVTNASGCSATSSATAVTVNALPTATITPNGPLTFATGGSVLLTSSSGSSYLWTPGSQTTQTKTVTTSGSYTVRVTNANGCSATSAPTVVTVTSSVPLPKVTASGPLFFCQGGSVTLTCDAANSYLWSTGATTQSINVTTSGSYSVTATTAAGTATSSPVTVTVTTPPAATITAGGATTFCSGGSVTLTASSGSAYLWLPGNQTTQTITVSTSGSYTVRVSNSSGCSATSTAKIVTVNPIPSATITAGGPLTFNSGGSVTLTASSGSSYLWLPGNQTTQSITVTTSGSYTVRVTNSSGCSATSAATVVTVNTSAASITPSGSTTFCSGGNVTLTASSGTAYLWSNGQTTQSILVTTTGTYTVTVYFGISSNAVSSPVTVTVNPLPTATITAGSATSFCSGGNVVLTASSGSSYLWLPGNQTTQSITVTTSGSYTVRVTNSGGCSKTSNATVVTVNNCGGTCTYPSGRYTNNITNSSAELHWNLMAVDSFFVKMRNMSTGTMYYTGALQNQINSITVGVAASTTYRWYVRSKCGTIKSPYSPYTSFTTLALRQSEPTTIPNVIDMEEGFDDEEFIKVNEISTNTPQNDFTLYPNPAEEFVNINLKSSAEGNVSIQLKDFAGRVITKISDASLQGLNIYRMDLANLAKGVYLISVESSEIHSTKRLVIK